MKKIVSLILGMCILILNTAVPMAADVTAGIEAFSFAQEFLYVQTGTDAVSLTYTYQPDGADTSSLLWTSDNESAVSVKDGILFPGEAGSANIYVYNWAGEKLDSIQVNVGEKDESSLRIVTTVSLYEDAVTMNVNDEHEIDYSHSSRLDSCTLFWLSDNEAAATAKDGIITAVGSGTANIRAVNLNGDELASLTVTVYGDENAEGDGKEDGSEGAEGGDVIVTGGIAFVNNETGVEMTELSLNNGDTYWINYYAKDENVSTDGISFDTSDGYIAWTDGKGVYACNPGTVYLYAYSADGTIIGTLTIYVNSSSEGGEDITTGEYVIFYNSESDNLKSISVDVNTECELVYFFSPEDADENLWYWYSTDENILSFEYGNGSLYLYTMAEGSADIIIENSKGTQIGCITVYVNGKGGEGEEGGDDNPTVSDMPTGITFYENDLTLSVGDEYYLSYSLSPDGANSEKLIWTVTSAPVESDTPVEQVNIITVDNGKVTALNPGYATIEVYNSKYDYLGCCNVNVLTPVVEMTDLSLNKNELNLTIYESETLIPVITPIDAECDGFNWYSDNSSIASVDSYGNVYAAGAGTTTVYVSDYDGRFTASCVVNVTPIYVESITLNESSVELFEGDYTELYATEILPSNATNKKVTWESDDTSVARVYSDGYVDAVGEGTAVIRATAKDGSGVYAECTVTVISRAVKGVELNKTELELTINETETLTATVMPSYASNQYVDWSSDNTAVASVNYNGKVTAKSEGTAVITVTTDDGGYTATCTVTVKRVPVTGISFENSEIEMGLNTNQYISAVIAPSNATNKNITYTSDNSEVLTVYSYGYMYANKEGTANVTATTEDGKYTAVCKVTVKRIPVTGVSFEENEIVLDVDYSRYIEATIEPSNATNKNITYTSSNSSVVSVTSYGYMHAYKVGTAVITATTEDGAFVAECTVTVPEVPVTGITLGNPTINVNIGSSASLWADVVPGNATNKKITYVSDNPQVASVDSYGYVYGESEGTAVVTATTEEGGYTATCNVTVKRVAVTGVSFDTTAYYYVGADTSQTLYTTVYPYNATNKNVTFSSSDETVASVEDGVMYIHKAGSAVITATTEDGGYTATVPVEVLLSMEETSLELEKGEQYTLNYAYNEKLLDGIEWSSSDENVATVENGVITAVGKGTARITMSCNYYMAGEEVHQLCCDINVFSIETSGNVTDTITWEYGGDNGTTLYIAGTGELPTNWGMYDYEFDFYRDSITDIVIGSGITKIGRYSFRYILNLAKVVISDTVSDIELYAFYDCGEFEYEISEGNTSYIVEDGVLFNKEKTILISYPSSKTDTVYEIPSTVTEVGVEAFEGNTYITRVVFGKNVTTINSSAFANCSALDTIIVDKKMSSIGNYAFSGCSPLAIYYYGTENEWWSISQDNANLYYSRLKFNYVPTTNEDGYEYYVKDGAAYIVEYTKPITENSFTVAGTLGGYPVKVIEQLAFANGEEFDELIIPEGVEIIDNYAFSEVCPKKIVIPSTVVKIGNYAIGGNLTEEIVVSANNPNFASENGVMFNKEKTILVNYPACKTDTSYTVPATVMYLGNSAFAFNKYVENVIIPEGVTNIGYFTFEGCEKLKSVTIPASVTSIEYAAFDYVETLTDVYYAGTLKRWNSIDIKNGNDKLASTTFHYGTVDVAPVYVKTGYFDYDNQCYYYYVYLNGIEAGKTVAIAYYYNGQLVYCDSQTYNGDKTITGEGYMRFASNFAANIDCIKVMVLENTETMAPVCAPAVRNILTDSTI